MLKEFKNLAPKSRVFIYQSDEKFTIQQSNEAKTFLESFIKTWQSHGFEIEASVNIEYDRFILISVDTNSYQASGCSIDKLSHLINELSQVLNINLLGRDVIYFDEKNIIKSAKLNSLKSKIEIGEMLDNTMVFNPMINTIEDLKENWIISLDKSWMSKYLTVKVL